MKLPAVSFNTVQLGRNAAENPTWKSPSIGSLLREMVVIIVQVYLARATLIASPVQGFVVQNRFVREQFFLAAAAQNLKRLVRFLSQPTAPAVEAAS